MVVIDPRRTETAKVADEHHFVRPGTDALVLLALLHQSSPTGARPARRRTSTGSARWSRRSADFTPERAAAVTGIDAEDDPPDRPRARDAARGRVYGRIGVSARQFGAVCQWAVQVLNVLTGNLDRPAARCSRARRSTRWARADRPRPPGRWRTRVRGLPEFGGELPVAALADEILTPGEGQVRALLTVAGNPVLSTPDGRGSTGRWRGLDFMAAVDLYVNETTRHADVILPPTPPLERDHYDLVFHLLAVRNTARFTPAVLPEARPGAARLGDLPRDRPAHGRRALRRKAR